MLSVPDGRRVTTLINATPIRDPDGPDDALASVVVTLQDLAPLQDIERMRAEFLGMVSHELRAPLTSIKGSAATALRTARLVGPAEVAQFFRIIDEQADRMDSLIGDLLDAGRIDTGTLSVAPEPSDVAVLVDQARGTFISGGGRHTVRIDLPPDLPRVMADRQRLVQVLNNLLANAARHAPDSAPIRIAAEREGLDVAVSVADEGRGHRAGPVRRPRARASPCRPTPRCSPPTHRTTPTKSPAAWTNTVPGPDRRLQHERVAGQHASPQPRDHRHR